MISVYGMQSMDPDDFLRWMRRVERLMRKATALDALWLRRNRGKTRKMKNLRRRKAVTDARFARRGR